jgi:hypothetical protein
MKQWKRVLTLGALLGGTFTAGVYAEDVLQRVEAFLRPDFKIVLNGNPVQLSGPTLIYDGSSYLPLKELGNMLGANVIFKDAEKTIYINSRINPEQTIEDNAGTDEFKFRNPLSIMVNYLGAQYPVLTANAEGTTNNSLVYYRLSDLRRMGIDTSAMKKSKEKLSEELYVTDSELKLFLKQLPTPVNTYSRDRYVITGEVNTKKIEAIQTHLRMMMNSQNEDNRDKDIKDFRYTTKPVIVDKMETENMYDYLFYQTLYLEKATISRYVRTKLILTKNEGESEGYTINSYGWTDLTNQLDVREQKKQDEANKIFNPYQ